MPSSLIYLLIKQTDSIMEIQSLSNPGRFLLTPSLFFLTILMSGMLSVPFYLSCGYNRMGLFLDILGLCTNYITYFPKSFLDIPFMLAVPHTLRLLAFRMTKSRQWVGGLLRLGVLTSIRIQLFSLLTLCLHLFSISWSLILSCLFIFLFFCLSFSPSFSLSFHHLPSPPPLFYHDTWSHSNQKSQLWLWLSSC